MFELEKERFDLLYHACAMHTVEHFSGNPTIDTCYDSDRLDLGRVRIMPAVDRMASEAGMQIVRRLVEAKIPYEHHRDWMRAFSF